MKFSNQNYYEILEIKQDASYKEIESAYRRAKETYSGDSPATYSLFTADECREILNAIEKAYAILSFSKSREEYDRKLAVGEAIEKEPQISLAQTQTEKKEAEPHKVAEPVVPVVKESNMEASVIEAPQQELSLNFTETFEGVEFNGNILRMVREKRRISLSSIADKTRISIIYLEHIEADRYQHLPADVYLKNYLMQYASSIGLDPRRVAEDYMRYYKEGINK